MAQASYFDTARRLASFLAKKTRFVTTSKLLNFRSCHKALLQSVCRTNAASLRANEVGNTQTGVWPYTIVLSDFVDVSVPQLR